MDIVLAQSQWTKVHVIQINSCRRFLQAQTLADISNMPGTRIHPEFIHGQSPPTPSSIRISKFNQQRPGEKAWKTWRRFLLTVSNKYGVFTNPLGAWTADVGQVRPWPKTLYDPDLDELMTHASHEPARMSCSSRSSRTVSIASTTRQFGAASGAGRTSSANRSVAAASAHGASSSSGTRPARRASRSQPGVISR